MDKFISLFQQKFYYYKNMILSFPNITDKNYINNNFELITIQKEYASERIYIDNNLSNDKLNEHIIKTNIKKLFLIFKSSFRLTVVLTFQPERMNNNNFI